MCFKYCDSFPIAVRAHRRRATTATCASSTARRSSGVIDTCFQCKLCEVQCPYTPRDRHEFQLDFPKLVHRYRRVRAQARGRSLRDRVLGDPDAAGQAGARELGPGQRHEPGAAPHRWLLEKAARRAPRQAAARLRRHDLRALGRAQRATSSRSRAARRCSSRPATCRTTSRRSARTRSRCSSRTASTCACVQGLACCGMPAWEHGDLETLRARARHNLDLLAAVRASAGAKVLAINPTCSMMMRREYPELVAAEDRERAAKLAAAVMDPREFLWSIRERAALQHATSSRTPGGRVAYHAPCHLRAQAHRLQGPRPAAQDPGRDADRLGDGVLRPRRHLRHDRGGLRALAADRQEAPSRA